MVVAEKEGYFHGQVAPRYLEASDQDRLACDSHNGIDHP